MTDFTTVPPGSSVGSSAPGLPPIDLPSEPSAPRRPTRVEIAKESPRPDPYAAYSDAPPAPPQQPADPYAAYSDAAPEKKPGREIGRGESGARGALDAISFGAWPAIAGIISAGMSPEERDASAKAREPGGKMDAHSELGSLIKGLSRLGYEHLIAPALGVSSGDDATKAYRGERDRIREEQQSAETQNPKSFIAGQLAGAVATPAFGAVKGATMAGRIGHAAKGGAIGGALYGAGEGVSEGQSSGDVAISAAKGAGTGALFGAGGAGALDTAAKIGRRVVNIAKGAVDPEKLASRQLGATLRADIAHGGPGIDPEAAGAAGRAGMPLAVVDVGGQGTRDLARYAVNHSSEALGDFERLTKDRAIEQHPRIRDTIRRMFGRGLDAGADQEALKSAARAANRPAYAAAYRAGDRPIWSPELERISASDAVQAALKKAVSTGKDRAIADKFGGFRPGVKVTPDGRVEFPKGPRGVPTYPNIQFWDYTQRALSDAAKGLEREHPDQAGALKGILNDLKEELDRQVPEFGAARRGAAQWFKAEDASEAGRNFISMNADPREARRALSKFSPPERELFARGFADELSQAVMRRQDNITVVKKAFIDSHIAREKINMALGPVRAKELEALLRAEAVGDRTKNILGNSQTARNINLAKIVAAHGAHATVGAGAVVGLESLKEANLSPGAIIGGAIILGGLRYGAHHIDAKVARKLGEMLVSTDPATLHRAAQIVARSPQLFDALRKGTAPGMRVAAHDIGANRTLAGIAALVEHIMAEENEHHHGADDQNSISQPVQQ